MDVLSEVWLAPKLRCAVKDATLVLIVDAMLMFRLDFVVFTEDCESLL